jgi:hypothetical protein
LWQTGGSLASRFSGFGPWPTRSTLVDRRGVCSTS